MTRKELINHRLTFPAAYEDYPFDNDSAHSDDGKWAVMRHRANRKGFAHIYERNGKFCINLKCEQLEANFLRKAFKDVTPGWHMNMVHWNTVYLNGDVSDEELKRQIEMSYELVEPKERKRR